MEKECTKCKELKFLIEFSVDKKTVSGRQNWCKKCQAEYSALNRTHIYNLKKKGRKIYWDTVERDARKRARIANRENYLLLAAKNRAKKYNIPFDITIDDIVIPKKCPILNIPLTLDKMEVLEKDCSPSIDKIIPELGYVKGNIMVISMKANRMKSNATIEELLIFADYIKKEYGNTEK